MAESCVKAIAERCGVKVNTRRNREVQLTSKLPPLVTSTHERADVLVYNKEDTKVVLLVEVNSSPMLYTERKAVLGAADMLRLLRHTDKKLFCIYQLRVSQEGVPTMCHKSNGEMAETALQVRAATATRHTTSCG